MILNPRDALTISNALATREWERDRRRELASRTLGTARLLRVALATPQAIELADELIRDLQSLLDQMDMYE